MWQEILLAVIGISSGIVVGGGFFALIIGLGIVSDFADRTHTGEHILLYEDSVALGGIVGSLWGIYQLNIAGMTWILPIYGMFTGIFVGCWAMALAETLNIFPILIRRVKILKCIPYIVLGMAIGRSVGAVIFFFENW